MKVIDKNKNKAVEVDSVSNNGEIYHVYDEGNQYRLFKDEVQVINQDTCIHEYEYRDVHNTLAYKFTWLYNIKYIGDIVNVWNEKPLLKKLDEVEK